RGIPSKLISIHSALHSLAKLEARLRMSAPPILSRLEHDRLLLDLRTVFSEDDVCIVRALTECVGWTGDQ
ncbi:MAG TPA: hypothetical protein VHP35_07830, partial [Terriglobia bacterium]|nr:hypothetical protein [Terriglobia bacterium]